MDSKKGFSIRRATLRDEDDVVRCLEQAFAPYRDRYTPGAFEDTVLTRDTLRARLKEMRVLVATDDSGQVLGTVAYKAENGEGHIRGMAVLPQWHGSGIARKLLDTVERDLRELHCRSITLDTTRPLRRAISFYEKNGFRETGERASFFGMDLIAYRKEI